MNIASPILGIRDTQLGGSTLLFVLWCIVVESLYLSIKHALNLIYLFPFCLEKQILQELIAKCTFFFDMTKFVSRAGISEDLLRSILLLCSFILHCMMMSCTISADVEQRQLASLLWLWCIQKKMAIFQSWLFPCVSESGDPWRNSVLSIPSVSFLCAPSAHMAVEWDFILVTLCHHQNMKLWKDKVSSSTFNHSIHHVVCLGFNI